MRLRCRIHVSREIWVCHYVKARNRPCKKKKDEFRNGWKGYEQGNNSEKGRKKENEEERKEMGRKRCERRMWNAHVLGKGYRLPKCFG